MAPLLFMKSVVYNMAYLSQILSSPYKNRSKYGSSEPEIARCYAVFSISAMRCLLTTTHPSSMG